MASPILPGTGLGSGIDTGAIVKALVNADKAAKQTQIDRQTSSNSAKISAVGNLKSALSAFQATMKGLGDLQNPQFLGFTASSSEAKQVMATATSDAVGGNYQVKVQQLATSSKVASAAFSGGAASPITAGTLTITQNGVGSPVTIPGGATLQSVRDAINTQMLGKGVTANIVTDSFGSRLVVGSTTMGAGSDITLGGIPELEVLPGQQLGVTPTATSAGAIGDFAKDAEFTVDGMKLTSKSNTVDKAISGLTLNLMALTPGESAVSVIVAPNNEGLKKSIQSFVDAYNLVVTNVTNLTKPSMDDDGKPTIPAALTGDPIARSILAAIREPLVTPGAGDKLTVLSQLGITTNQKTGALDFDATKFGKGLSAQGLGSDVQKLFLGDPTKTGEASKGLLSRMDAVIVPYTVTGKDGILDSRSTGLAKVKTNLANQQLALDRRVETLTAMLTKKYNDMDTLVGKLKATASNITSMFDAMNAQKKG